MKKFFVMLFVVFLLSGQAWGANPYVTSNTVSFSTAPMVVSFSTVINHIVVYNESASQVAYLEFDGYRLGWISTDNTVRVFYRHPNKTDYRLRPSTTITLDVNTDKMGYIGESGNGTITWIATSEKRVSNNTSNLDWTDI